MTALPATAEPCAGLLIVLMLQVRGSGFTEYIHVLRKTSCLSPYRLTFGHSILLLAKLVCPFASHGPFKLQIPSMVFAPSGPANAVEIHS
jgi:hypothetical protein